MRWLAIGLFVVAVVVLLFLGQAESRKKREAVEVAEQSVEIQLQRENTGTTSPEGRITFLRNQKKIIGTIKGRPVPVSAVASPEPSKPESEPTPTPEGASIMPVVVTGVLGLFALGLVVKGTKEDDARQWAFATLGTVVGYWLKG